MRRRRLNLKLLAILCGSTLVLMVGVHFLHKFMLERNAGALLTLAEQAEEKQELRKAVGYLRTYANFRPDDISGYVRLANLAADIAESPSATPNDYLAANSALEVALLKSPDDLALRRRLVDIKLRIGRLREARENLKVVVKALPDELENHVLLAQCYVAEGNTRDAERLLYEMIGYDFATGTFDPQQARGAKYVPAYVTLAEILRTQSEAPEQADAVMNQLIATSGDDFRAYLERGNYRLRHNQAEAAIHDIERAYQMAPEDADVLLASAELESSRGNSQLAQQQLELALEKFPDQSRVYRARANLELTQNLDPKSALAFIEQGLKATKDDRSLLSFKAELQLRAGELHSLQKTIDEMKAADLEQEVVSFYRARKLLAEQQWVAGARELERLRPLVARSPERQMEINLYLGLCYERLGQPDRALETYQMTLRADARQQLAREGIERVQFRTGQLNTPNSDPLSQRVTEMLKVPEAERDWQAIDTLVEQHIREKKLSELAATAVWARLMGMRGEFAAAQQRLAPMLEKHPQNSTLWLLAIELARQNPEQGGKLAMQLAQEAEKHIGDTVELRLAKGVLLLQQAGSEAGLAPLEENTEQFSRAERRKLWAGLAGLYLYSRATDDVRRMWQLLAEDDPNDLAIRLQILELALQENELEHAAAAQQEILDLVKTKEDSAWQYAEAGRLLLESATKTDRTSTLKTALEHVDRVLRTRSQWHLAHALRGRILIQLERFDDAIAALQRSMELGKPRLSDVRQLVQLLTYRGRFAEAQKAMALAGDEGRLGMQPEVLAEIHLRSGDMEQGLDVAEQAVQRDPKNPLKLLWYGQVLARAGQFTESARVLQRAIQAAPRMPQPYLALITLHAQRGETAQAEAVINSAASALEAENKLLVLARGEELVGDWQQAEKYYLESLANAPTNTVKLRSLATFYLSGGYRGPDGMQKAEPLVKQVLQAPASGVTSEDDAAWARRAMATIRAAGGTYPDLVAALALIEQNATNGRLRRDDQLQAAVILALRPEAVSRRKAIRYFQDLQASGELPVREQLILADLYERMDEWDACRSTMLDLISRHGKEPVVLATFARLLLEHEQLEQAQRYIARLEEVDPQDLRTLPLRAELLRRQGKPEAAARLITANLPTQPEKADIPRLAKAFMLLKELQLTAAAEQVLRQLVALDPSNRAALAEFLGYNGNVDEAFSLLHDLSGKVPDIQLAQVGVQILHVRRGEVGNKYDPQVENWLSKASLGHAKDSAVLQASAQLADLQGRYADEERYYREMLANHDVQGNRRALVLNNLAFNLAMRDKSNVDTRALVDEAIEIHGPTGALLDTRAMVSLFSGEHTRAISDLNLAISDQPKPERLFHLALAQLVAGNKEAALRAYQEAERRGLTAERISALERKHYDRLVQELGTKRAASEASDRRSPRIDRDSPG